MHAVLHTSLEAVDGAGDLDSACQQVGQCRERCNEQESEHGGGGEEQRLGVVMVDLCECVHRVRASRVMLAWRLRVLEECRGKLDQGTQQKSRCRSDELE